MVPIDEQDAKKYLKTNLRTWSPSRRFGGYGVPTVITGQLNVSDSLYFYELEDMKFP